LLSASLTWYPAIGAEIGDAKAAGGLRIYIGGVPAEIVKGQHPAGPVSHGRIPKGAQEYHVAAAVFDAATDVRMTDAAR
jgi:hypothetical protein